MFRLFLPIFFLALATAGLSAQQTKYQVTTSFGLSGLNANTLSKGAFSGASLDRIAPVTTKTSLLFGLGLQYSNYEVGANEAPCVFPLGDKAVTFTFSETYEFNPLEGVLRFGAQHRFGKLTVRGLVLPTFRLHDRITSTYSVNFDQVFLPPSFSVSKVNPGESFLWDDGTTRELRYNSPFHLRAGLELDFQFSKQLALGLGYQAGLSKYQLTNYLQDTRPGDEMTEFVVTEEDARTAQGYLLMRVQF